MSNLLVSITSSNPLNNLLFKMIVLVEKLYVLTVAILILYILYLTTVALKIYIKNQR